MKASPAGTGSNPVADGGPFPRFRAWRACIRATGSVVFIACLTVTAQAGSGPGGIEHIVIVWLQEPGNVEHRNRVIAASQVLIGIPGVRSLKAGSVIPGEREIVDSSFDVALIVSFTDRAALNAYLTHPLHVTLVEETLKPLVRQIRVYDFTNR
ncbi:MAG: Dabb family protein [Gammaproteobacteria bacterium]|jgi:hypothetical protein